MSREHRRQAQGAAVPRVPHPGAGEGGRAATERAPHANSGGYEECDTQGATTAATE